ncbi:glycosyltransferase family 4 protein [Roseovarius litoreus]|uniref:glycosyltransferase family 4 protein n=1 Tax=Roseovarius litoreus TaxID=1155722 RepID=UPI00165F7F69|nr:glycosyltransferase family 4 protein [Roseovarius litoreus]
MCKQFPIHVLYLYFDDISAAKGPSVNEREFLNGLAASGIPFTAVIPEPARHVEVLGFQDVLTVSPLRSSRLHQSVFGQLSVLSAAISVLRRSQNKNHHIVVRLPALPWAVNLLALFFPHIPLHVKSLGDTDFLKRKGGLNGLLLKPVASVQSWMVRSALKRVQTIDTVTEKLAGLIARTNKLDPGKIHVIPNGTNTKRFHPTTNHITNNIDISRNQFVVGYVGGQPFTRGGRQIIQAVSRLSDLLPEIRCRIAGGDVQDLERVAIEYGVESRCDIVGKIPYDDVNDFLNSLDVLFATDDSSRAKMLGNSNQKIRQALSIGVPVISNSEAEADFLKNNLIHAVDTDDIDEVCNSLFLIYNIDALQRKAFARKARNFIHENYSLNVLTERRLNIWAAKRSGNAFWMKDDGSVS